MKKLMSMVFVLFPLVILAQADHFGKVSDHQSPMPLLPVTFGKITRMEVVVINGDQLKKKSYTGAYLLKVESIDNIRLSEPVIMAFKDETRQLPADRFEMYRRVDKGKAKSIDPEKIRKAELRYVGKKYTIMAYETGRFSGFPEGYFDYQPIRSGSPFHFENSLIVIAIIDPNESK